MSSISPAVCQHTSELQEIAMSGKGGRGGKREGRAWVSWGEIVLPSEFSGAWRMNMLIFIFTPGSPRPDQTSCSRSISVDPRRHSSSCAPSMAVYVRRGKASADAKNAQPATTGKHLIARDCLGRLLPVLGFSNRCKPFLSCSLVFGLRQRQRSVKVPCTD